MTTAGLEGFAPGLAALVHVAYGPFASERRLLMLEAYLDESHDERSETVLCLAGLIAPANLWNCFWGAWDRALVDEGLPEFHMVDCEHGKNAFKGMPPGRREQLQRRFLGILTSLEWTGLTGAVTAILLEPYAKLQPRIKALRAIPNGQRVSGALDDPYFLAFQHAVELMAVHPAVAPLPTTERIAFVFDRHHLKGRAQAIYESVLNAPDLPYRARLGPVVFHDRRLIKPLQAADILAYEHYRYLYETELRGEPERWQFTALRSLPVVSRVFRDTELTKVMEAIERDAKARGLPTTDASSSAS